MSTYKSQKSKNQSKIGWIAKTTSPSVAYHYAWKVNLQRSILKSHVSCKYERSTTREWGRFTNKFRIFFQKFLSKWNKVMNTFLLWIAKSARLLFSLSKNRMIMIFEKHCIGKSRMKLKQY
jgi:hypothetical protein